MNILKKILSLAIITIPIIASGQSNHYKAYAELLGYEKGLFTNKVKVNVDFGQEVSFWKRGDMRIVDENGKDIVFNSMVDAMNFMGKHGWQFVQAYVVTHGNQNVYHWLLSKDVSSDEDIKSGFNVKSDFNGINDNVYVVTYFSKPKTSNSWDEIKSETYKDISTFDELLDIINQWKNQESETYDFDCKVTKK